MVKKYDLFKTSDMNRFEKDLENSIMNSFREHVLNGSYNYECPNCKKIMRIHQGNSTCPNCNESFNVEFKINYN